MTESKVINQEYEIEASIKEVWKALVDPEYIEGWGGGPVKMNDQVGTDFTLWGGDIWGTNIEVEPEKKLVQNWYGGDWKEPSKVTFTLEDRSGKTIVKLIHANLPDGELENFDTGWKDYYLGEIKSYLENK